MTEELKACGDVETIQLKKVEFQCQRCHYMHNLMLPAISPVIRPASSQNTYDAHGVTTTENSLLSSVRELTFENISLKMSLDTERTMKAAWEKRAYQAEKEASSQNGLVEALEKIRDWYGRDDDTDTLMYIAKQALAKHRKGE
jgi:hypothetical protein